MSVLKSISADCIIFLLILNRLRTSPQNNTFKYKYTINILCIDCFIF